MPILQNLGWVVGKHPNCNLTYYYNGAKRKVQVAPPYFAILGLDELNYGSIAKQDIWSYFFQRKMEYKQELSEELKDPSTKEDWDLIMEAFKVLVDPISRATYEQQNLVPSAQAQLGGMRVMHRKLVIAAAEKAAKEEAERAAAQAEADAAAAQAE
eukprot:gnl/MRDRNA2_/MRDRNA2_94851_c0_seq1.p1 gnl/MRDRNA2_/MRDRNA2_94851_c0~~gnl/MRDRNA2_/MRDRNA2_94851_c0_seq1.p1  ORF type:complete len:156 (+),score=54.91 gnl/MRDRNA2_/MRDRNA2_94851_c0_seq1:139-606(+)